MQRITNETLNRLYFIASDAIRTVSSVLEIVRTRSSYRLRLRGGPGVNPCKLF